MLQERVNELKSAILDIHGTKVYVTGFTREEMLQRYLNNGSECFSSKGMYDYQNLHFHEIRNNAFIIIRQDEKEVSKYQYKSVYRDTAHFKDEEGKSVSLTFTIRKSTYSDHYHFFTEKLSVLFNNKGELDKYLLDKFGVSFSY